MIHKITKTILHSRDGDTDSWHCRWSFARRYIDTIFTNHHHHVVPLAQISLTVSRHFSLSFIASGRSSGLHPVSSHSCCMYVRAGRPAFARPYVGVHRSTSLMSSSLLLQQCPACLVRLTWIVFVIGWWPHSWCLVGWCHQDLLIWRKKKCENGRYWSEIITDVDYADNLALCANRRALNESKWHWLEQAAFAFIRSQIKLSSWFLLRVKPTPH